MVTPDPHDYDWGDLTPGQRCALVGTPKFLVTIARLLFVALLSLPIGAWRLYGGSATITDINLSSTTVLTTASNAGVPIGDVLVTMSDNGTYTGAMTLSGPNGTLFTLTNGGLLPSTLTIGASNIGTTGTNVYSITINAP